MGLTKNSSGKNILKSDITNDENKKIALLAISF